MLRRAALAALAIAIIAVVAVPAEAGHEPICANPYPPEEAAAGHGGTVTMTLTITAQGTVKDIAIRKSSGFPVLDNAAVACAANWLFRVGNQKVLSTTVEMHFGMQSVENSKIGGNLTTDILRCVKGSVILGRLSAGFSGVTDLYFTFPANAAPGISVYHASGAAELDAMAMKCAKESPALAKLGEEIRASSLVLPLNWSAIPGLLPGP